MDGKIDVVVHDCNGEPFLFPNDLCFGPDGYIYMTDSGVVITEFAPNNRIRDDYEHVHYEGRVFRINPANGHSVELDRDLKFPNGIAFDADNNLYVNVTVTGDVYRYCSKPGFALGRREYFGNVNDPAGPAGWRGPDGMAFGADGQLFVAVFGQGDVTVLDKKGEVTQRIKTQGNLPTNVAFARSGKQKLYVTEYELGAFECFDTGVEGLPLHAAKNLSS